MILNSRERFCWCRYFGRSLSRDGVCFLGVFSVRNHRRWWVRMCSTVGKQRLLWNLGGLFSTRVGTNNHQWVKTHFELNLICIEVQTRYDIFKVEKLELIISSQSNQGYWWLINKLPWRLWLQTETLMGPINQRSIILQMFRNSTAHIDCLSFGEILGWTHKKTHKHQKTHRQTNCNNTTIVWPWPRPWVENSVSSWKSWQWCL